MGALVTRLAAGLAYFSIASVLAVLVLLGAAWYSGKLNSSKMARLRAVLHGVDEPAVARTAPVLESEQPSYDEILEQRAINFRQLELREEIVRQNVAHINRQRGEITASRQDFDRAKKMFDDELTALRTQADSAGEENVRLTFENIKPLQAKQQITMMLDRGEMEKVVTLLSSLSINKRAKIAAEFKTPDDAARLSKILELMGDGEPLTSLVDQSRGTEDQPATQR